MGSSSRPLETSSRTSSATATTARLDEDAQQVEEAVGSGREVPSDLPSKADPSKVDPAEEGSPELVTWDGSNDPENPHNWSVKYRWFITLLISINNLNVTYASSSPSTTVPFVQQALHTSKEVSYLVTTVFLIGYVCGPVFWGPGSEMFGRRAVLIPALTLYTLFHLGQALAQNIQTLLITRFLSGFFASAPLNNSGGVMADLWDAEMRGRAASLLFTAIFLGPALGPVVGGFVVSSSAGWRWVFWVEMIFAGVITIVSFLFMPETYGPFILRQRAKRLRKEDPVAHKDIRAEGEEKWTFNVLLERTIFQPFRMLWHEPILVFVTAYMSVVFALLYSLFEAFPVIFIGHHGLSISQDGLIFLGVGIGTTIGAVSNLFIAGNRYKVLMVEWRGFPPPEQRLYGAAIAGPMLVVGIFWLGWTGAYTEVPWYVPALSTIVIGASISLVFLSFLSYLVDTYLMFAASAFAANTMVRSALASVFPLFTTQMYNNMGIQWATTLIGLIAAVLVPIPFLFLKYGARIRKRSKFAPCVDLKIAEKIAAEKAVALTAKAEV
ncbi:MFS general substrate transporter [Gloeopeniophorella convolvens]|nr:MFS general substrate transporter [Gloeopeniophorella convolvens]